MKLSIKNIGKIESADIKLDGITVICGENNTGKSTVGKVLFSYFNSMCDFENKIKEQRIIEIRNCLFKYDASRAAFKYVGYGIEDEINKFICSENDITIKDINEFLSKYSDITNKKLISEDIFKILNTSNEDLMSEYIFRYFSDVFNGQVKTSSKETKQGVVKTTFKNGTNTINFLVTKCRLNQEVPVAHCAYYINNPFVVDYLNSPRFRISGLSELERNIIDTVQNAQREQDINKMSDIFDVVANKDKLEGIKVLLKNAYNGQTVRKNGLYFYNDGKSDIDFRNLSTGLKSFALIERLLECGKLKSKDVLILDEPEIHLHPEWQLVYAELIVLLQKTFDLTILLVTHSFHFLESLNFFIDKYNITERGNFYTPQKSENGFIIVETNDALYDSMDSLSKSSFELARMKTEFEMENENDETD
ncbi:MAG: AAA family ATPase [Ruminococcus flavefaciens]|nr:AAA family ATPase [Ruminococcus flavefaciens]